MNVIWCIITTLSIIMMMIKGEAGLVVSTLIGSGTSAVNFCLRLAALNCIWCGIIKLSEDAGIINVMSRVLSKPIKWLFGEMNEKATHFVTVSLAANITGLSGGATPAAVNAINEMDKDNNTANATYPMTMLFVINASGLSLIPATVIGLRASAGSASPADIVLPNFIVTLINTAIGVLLVMLVYNRRKITKAMQPVKMKEKCG